MAKFKVEIVTSAGTKFEKSTQAETAEEAEAVFDLSGEWLDMSVGSTRRRIRCSQVVSIEVKPDSSGMINPMDQMTSLNRGGR